jgi:uncharacterized protein YndB with AHSA1/START domain
VDEAEILIARPMAEVFAVLAEPERNPQVLGFPRITKLDEGPAALGTRYHAETGEPGMDLTLVWTEFEPPRRLAFRAESAIHMGAGTIQPEGGYTLEPVLDLTRLRRSFDPGIGGFARFLNPVLSRLLRMGGPTDLNRLKDLIESG